jgi:hypothetical protein
MALGKFAKPALVRLLLAPVSDYSQTPTGPCRWDDQHWVLTYCGCHIVAGLCGTDLATFAGLPYCAVVGRLGYLLVASSDASQSGLDAAAALSGISAVLAVSPNGKGRDFRACCLGLRAYMWALRDSPIEAATAMAEVRKVCELWPPPRDRLITSLLSGGDDGSGGVAASARVQLSSADGGELVIGSPLTKRSSLRRLAAESLEGDNVANIVLPLRTPRPATLWPLACSLRRPWAHGP